MSSHTRSQKDCGKPAIGSLLSVPKRFILTSRLRLPTSRRVLGSSILPPSAAPYPSAQRRAAGPARGHLERRDRSRHARCLPAPIPPAHSPNSCGRSLAGVGGCAQKPAGAPPPRGVQDEGCSHCPQCPLPYEACYYENHASKLGELGLTR